MMQTSPDLQVQARALGEPTRHAIFRYLADAGRPVGVAELTEHLDRHHNAIRQHLERLVGAGLVVEAVAPRTGRGRPRLEYRVDPRADARWAGDASERPYERLSMILADALRTGTTPEDAGRRAGLALLAASSTASGDTIAVVADVMARSEFEPEVALHDDGDGADIVLRACPFASAARTAPEVVCAVHRGIADAVAESCDDEIVVDALAIEDPSVAGCRLTLRRAPSG